MGKTYLCGKIGKSVKFNPNTWSATGGDNETPTLLLKMAELNPDCTFIIIGRNDLTKSGVKYPKNLFSAWDDGVKNGQQTEYLVEKLKDIKIDGCFLVAGPTGSTNMLNKALKREPLKKGLEEYALTLEMHLNYSGPIYNYLNESNIPWVMISNDPRYMRMGRDCLNPPKKILSQANGNCKMTKIKSWDDQVNLDEVNIEFIYAGMEKIFLIDKKLSSNFERNKKFMVVLNEGNNGVKSRYPELKKYVLDYIDDVEIYGQWDKELVKDDLRFKGSKKFNEIQEMLQELKYTFIITIKDGWSTMKIWEMIGNGVIPFLHPEYDSQNNLDVPDFIRIKEPKDLHEKIEYLENNPDEYKRILNECLNCIKEEDTSGLTLSNTIINEMQSYNFTKDGKEFKDTIEKKITIETDEW